MRLPPVDARLATLLALAALAGLAAALYLPYIGNPLVFDDRSFFSGRRFGELASSPFALELRRPPYFSIAFTHVFTWRVEAHRLVSLALHTGCALALFGVLLQLRLSRLPAFLAAAFFALHPAAVYAAGYLVQRSIVLATLFALLSLLLFVRGLRRQGYGDAVSAAACYWIAVLSKEHSILLPAAVLLAAPLATANWRFAVRFGGLYAACCAPAAVLVYLLSASLIGTAYEPALAIVAPQVEAAASGSQPAAGAVAVAGPWLASVMAQAGLFYRYLAAWLWPDTGAMAVDMPMDVAGASAGAGAVALGAFAALGVLAFALLLRRRGWPALLAYGLLFAWLAFFVEFSAVRFQEPFVLYRSYLWAPGLAIAVAALLQKLPRPAALAGGLAVLAVLSYGAADRLDTFASPLALWQDAAAKLPEPPPPGGARTMFNLAREQFYAGQVQQAEATADACIARYPEGFYCHFGRGSLRLQQASFEAALPDLERALALHSESGMAHHHRGVALEGIGRLREARVEYELARKFGFGPADYRLRQLDDRQRGAPAIRSAAPPRD